MAMTAEEKKKVPVGLCEVGDLLAEDVFNRKGQKMVSGGTTLSEKLLKRLTAAGIRRVTVRVEADPESDFSSPEDDGKPDSPSTRETKQGTVIIEDLSTNYAARKDVVLEGDLKDGAVLSSTGNVEIVGEIHNGTVRTLSGRMKVQGQIASKGDPVQLISNQPIQVGSVVNSHLSVRGPLIVRGNVENARIECQGNLVVYNPQNLASLIDAEIEIRGRLLADQILHRDSSGSELRFLDPDVVDTRRKQQKARSKIDRLKTEREKLKNLVNTVKELGEKVRTLAPKKKRKLKQQTEKYKKTERELEKTHQVLEDLQAKLQDIKNQRRFFMRVLDLLKAGTSVDFEGTQLEVNRDETDAKLYKKGVIVIKDASEDTLNLREWLQ